MERMGWNEMPARSAGPDQKINPHTTGKNIPKIRVIKHKTLAREPP